MRRLWAYLVFGLIAAAGIALAAAVLKAGKGGANNLVPPVTDYSSHAAADRATTAKYLGCTGGSEPANFHLYSLGPSFNGLSLSAILRRCDTPYPGEPNRANYVSYIYGDCTPANEEGCAPPLEIQIWPACERNAASYDVSPTKVATLRGVPAADFGGGRLELYAGASTIVIFARDLETATDAASRLRSESQKLAPDAAALASAPTPGKFAKPVAGATTGRLSCTDPAAQR